ncbi:MAG: tRNA pseudouridine(38-40) synthase TruA [Chloroflexi bacterium]|nr:tRNA pseudouridine(38-40) synthase TruA [Chloroflexota bacterium]
MRLALTIEYEGTRYHGFQYQVDAPTIQGELERAIEKLTGESVRVKGAGRTDAGVHAEAQVVVFDTDSAHSTETFVSALNHYLPADIAVRAAHIVAQDFDPRRHARSRTYRYGILNSRTPSPLARRFTCHIRDTLDVERMQEAAGLFVGTHDFRKFAAPLSMGRTSSVRTIHRASIAAGRVVRQAHHERSPNAQNGELLVFNVTGNAFLQHQVRRMAGALVDIGRGRLSEYDLQAMIDNRETDKVAHSLPAHGLCLVKVEYENYPPTQ